MVLLLLIFPSYDFLYVHDGSDDTAASVQLSGESANVTSSTGNAVFLRELIVNSNSTIVGNLGIGSMPEFAKTFCQNEYEIKLTRWEMWKVDLTFTIWKLDFSSPMLFVVSCVSCVQ